MPQVRILYRDARGEQHETTDVYFDGMHLGGLIEDLRRFKEAIEQERYQHARDERQEAAMRKLIAAFAELKAVL